MMPKPNQQNHKININRNEFNGVSSEKVLHETKPNFWLYSDNFILKIVVLFLLVLMFAPIMTLVYSIHSQLIRNFHIAIDNMMFYSELIIFLCIFVVIVKLALDVLDWNYTNYVFTDARIIIERGFIHKDKLIISYNKIQDIEIRQSLLERIIGVGDIIVYGANEMSETILDDIPSPRDVEEIIITNVNRNSFNNQTYPYQPYNNPYTNQQGNYNQQNQQAYQYNNQQGYQYIQPDYEERDSYDENVIVHDKQNNDNNDHKYSKTKPDKDEIFRKHDEMFKRHKK